MSEQQTGFIKFRRVDSISGTPDPRTLYLINRYSGVGADAVITNIDLQFGSFSVGTMNYTAIPNSNNDVILSFTYNDISRQLEVKANLKRDTAGTNLLKIGGTGWYVDTADVESIIDSYIVTTFPTTVTDTTVPSTKLVKTSLDSKESVDNKVTTVRVDGTATDEAYPSERAVRTAINTAVQGLPVGGHTHVISDVEGLQASLDSKVNVQSNWAQTNNSADDYIKNKPALATVATTGSFNDLTDKPALLRQVSFTGGTLIVETM